MALQDTIARFGEQFEWDPVIINNTALETYSSSLIAGMGGSHLGAWLIDHYGAPREMRIHRDYGLPNLPMEDETKRLCIASSYSGTTEETIDAFEAARKVGMPTAVVSKGGTLIERAGSYGTPHIVLPDTGLEPRMAIGYAMLAIARLLRDKTLEEGIRSAGKNVYPLTGQSAGATLAEKLHGRIPLVWASHANIPIAYIWKVKFNETSKVPCFCNYFPELSHNEFTGFDVQISTRELSAPFVVIMLDDPFDHPRIQKRMQLTSQMLAERDIAVEHVTLSGTGFTKAFEASLMADWVTLPLALHYGVPNPETPLIAEFKKRMAQ